MLPGSDVRAPALRGTARGQRLEGGDAVEAAGGVAHTVGVEQQRLAAVLRARPQQHLPDQPCAPHTSAQPGLMNEHNKQTQLSRARTKVCRLVVEMQASEDAGKYPNHNAAKKKRVASQRRPAF